MESSPEEQQRTSRPQMKIRGSSRNPEYDFASTSPRFKRKEGRRLAPISQLNSRTGRMLARNPVQKDHGNMSDRARLTSQRPRNELSQLLGKTCSSQPADTSYCQGVSEQFSLAQEPCPECGQSETNHHASAGFSHICDTCHRFVPVQVTVVQPTPPPTKPLPPVPVMPPTPPSKVPRPVKCDTCLAIPRYLYEEYSRFFTPCIICGHMTDITLTDLIAAEGEVRCLTDNKGKRITAPSKELQDWCVYVAFNGQCLSRKTSSKSTAASIASRESTKLQRKGAVRRSGTSSTTSSRLSASSRDTAASRHSELIPVHELGRRIEYTRRFSFETIPVEDTKAAAHASRRSEPPGKRRAESTSHSDLQESRTDARDSSSRQETAFLTSGQKRSLIARTFSELGL